MVSIVSEKQIEVRKGEYIKITCSATGAGADGFVYQWYWNDLPVAPVANQHTATLVITVVSEENTGGYKCFVRNQYNGTGQSKVITLVLSKLLSTFCKS